MASQEATDWSATERDRLHNGVLEDLSYVIVFSDSQPRPDPNRPKDKFHVLVYDRIEISDVEIRPETQLSGLQRTLPANITMKSGATFSCCVFARVEKGVKNGFMEGVVGKLEREYSYDTTPSSKRLQKLVNRFPDMVLKDFNYPDRDKNQKFEMTSVSYEPGRFDHLVKDVTMRSETDFESLNLNVSLPFGNDTSEACLTDSGEIVTMTQYDIGKAAQEMASLDLILETAMEDDSPSPVLGKLRRTKSKSLASQRTDKEADETAASMSHSTADSVSDSSQPLLPVSPAQESSQATQNAIEKVIQENQGSPDLPASGQPSRNSPDTPMVPKNKDQHKKRRQGTNSPGPSKARKKLKVASPDQSTQGSQLSQSQRSTSTEGDSDGDFESMSGIRPLVDDNSRAKKFAEPYISIQVSCGPNCRCNAKTSLQLREDYVNKRDNAEHACIIIYDREQERLRGRHDRYRRRLNSCIERVEKLELHTSATLEYAKVLAQKQDEDDQAAKDEKALRLPWRSPTDMLRVAKDEDLLEALARHIAAVNEGGDKDLLKTIMSTLWERQLLGRLLLVGNSIPKAKNGKVVILGEEYHSIPKKLLDALVSAASKRLSSPEEDVRSMLKNHLNTERAARKRAVSSHLEYLNSKNSHLLFEALWVTHECGLHIFQEAAPLWGQFTYDDRSKYMDKYVEEYEAAVRQYKEKHGKIPKIPVNKSYRHNPPDASQPVEDE